MSEVFFIEYIDPGSFRLTLEFTIRELSCQKDILSNSKKRKMYPLVRVYVYNKERKNRF